MLSNRLTTVLGTRCSSSPESLDLSVLRDHDPALGRLLEKKISTSVQKAVLDRLIAIWQADRDVQGNVLDDAKTDLTKISDNADLVRATTEGAVKRLNEVFNNIMTALPVTVADAARRKQEAVEDFHRDLRFVTEFIKDRQDNDRDKLRIQDRVRIIRTDPSYDPLTPNETLDKLQARMKHLQADHKSAVALLDDHFQTGLTGSSASSRDSVTLSLPRDMSGSKLKLVIQSLTRFLHSRVHDLFLPLLVLRRMNRDRDHSKGGRTWLLCMYDVEECLHDAWRTQSKLLYSHLTLALPISLRNHLSILHILLWYQPCNHCDRRSEEGSRCAAHAWHACSQS